MHCIMFCAVWMKSASLVHFGLNEPIFQIFPLFLTVYFTIYYLYIYEVVNIYMEHVDSMRHFAMLLMNK
jgi:hypothetical protein